MTKRIINFLINILLILLFIYIFIYSKNVKETIIYGINIWLYNLFPSMFPFLLVSKLIIYNNLFNIANNTKMIVFLSLFTGFPTGALYTKELLEQNLISINDANKLIMYTSYSSPIFVISVVGESLLNNKLLGIYIYIIHVISGLIINIFVKGRNTSSNIARKQNNNILFKSINESFETLINMLGIIIFFLIIISIINTFFTNNLLSISIKSILELTTGVINISRYNISLKLKLSFIGALISFNGLSVHYQVKNIIYGSNIKYKNYLYARIVHSVICFILIYLSYSLLI